MDSPPMTLYVGRVVQLPPLAAQAAFDACSTGTGSDEWLEPERRSWSVRSREAILVLRGQGLVERTNSLSPFRSFAGYLGSARRRLVSPAWLTTPVRLELVPWSETGCELGLYPAGRSIGFAPSLRQQRYFELAGDVVEHLCGALEEWALGELERATGTTSELASIPAYLVGVRCD